MRIQASRAFTMQTSRGEGLTNALPPAGSQCDDSCREPKRKAAPAVRSSSPLTSNVRVPLRFLQRGGLGGTEACWYNSWCHRNTAMACVNAEGYCSNCCHASKSWSLERRLAR